MRTRLALKLLAAFVIELSFFALILFAAAGSLKWTEGWLFLGVMSGSGLILSVPLLIKNPELVEQRLKPPMRKDSPAWDKALMPLLFLFMFVWLALAGFDWRLGWTHVSPALEWVGGVGLVVTISLAVYPMFFNPFADVAVRVQTERGHRVISTGPYAIVRHPLYAGALLYPPFAGLLLGSWVATWTSLAITAGIIVRTALEDKELQRSLPGYQEYAQKVRYRLLPGIW